MVWVHGKKKQFLIQAATHLSGTGDVPMAEMCTIDILKYKKLIKFGKTKTVTKQMIKQWRIEDQTLK